MKRKIIIGMLLMMVMLFSKYQASAQTRHTLLQLIEAARENNHLLSVKQYQIEEKISKLEEDRIKKYPSATLDGNYQYNYNLPELTIPAGSLGEITSDNNVSRPLPEQASQFSVGQKGNYNVGMSVYQPLSQQLKINTGLAIDKTDIKMLKKEKEKTALEIQLTIEQFYYDALITQKQSESETAKLILAKAKLHDAEGAFLTGKTTGVSTAGLHADIAGLEQNLLKLDIQFQDYLSELSTLTRLNVVGLEPEETGQVENPLESIDEYKSLAFVNPDMEIASLNKEKALLGIKAAKQSNLPDLGVIAGYYVQAGNPLLATNSPYVGITLKWNIQDLFTNKQVTNQRISQLKQAEETMAHTRQQVESGVEKAWRKVKQSASLVSVAKKLVNFRQEALKEQVDRQGAGMDIKTALLEMKSQLAEAEVSLYAAQLSKTIAIAQLKNLSGQVN